MSEDAVLALVNARLHPVQDRKQRGKAPRGNDHEVRFGAADNAVVVEGVHHRAVLVERDQEYGVNYDRGAKHRGKFGRDAQRLIRRRQTVIS